MKGVERVRTVKCVEVVNLDIQLTLSITCQINLGCVVGFVNSMIFDVFILIDL
ncbi:hypothetical protein TUM4433_31070 [Shewanella schlegeliana]|nr:hypothetical protein TUM4433_31070 [Shewanella schlegeliana]